MFPDFRRKFNWHSFEDGADVPLRSHGWADALGFKVLNPGDGFDSFIRRCGCDRLAAKSRPFGCYGLPAAPFVVRKSARILFRRIWSGSCRMWMHSQRRWGPQEDGHRLANVRGFRNPLLRRRKSIPVPVVAQPAVERVRARIRRVPSATDGTGGLKTWLLNGLR